MTTNIPIINNSSNESDINSTKTACDNNIDEMKRYIDIINKAYKDKQDQNMKKYNELVPITEYYKYYLNKLSRVKSDIDKEIFTTPRGDRNENSAYWTLAFKKCSSNPSPPSDAECQEMVPSEASKYKNTARASDKDKDGPGCGIQRSDWCIIPDMNKIKSAIDINTEKYQSLVDFYEKEYQTRYDFIKSPGDIPSAPIHSMCCINEIQNKYGTNITLENVLLECNQSLTVDSKNTTQEEILPANTKITTQEETLPSNTKITTQQQLSNTPTPTPTISSNQPAETLYISLENFIKNNPILSIFISLIGFGTIIISSIFCVGIIYYVFNKI